MRRWSMGRFPLALLPLMLSGCCTYLTVDSSTHTYNFDRLRRIEKAAVTPDDRLVILVEGATAESSRVRRFTITVPLPTNEDFIRVPPEGMVRGWEPGFPGRPDALPVALAPPETIPAYESVGFHQRHFSEITNAERVLYLVQHSKPDRQTPLFYVEKGRHPRKIEIVLDGREVKTPGRYPFLLFVPVTVAVDIVTLPVQLYLFSTWGDKHPHSVVPLSATNSPAK